MATLVTPMSRGEIVHADEDWNALYKEFEECADHEAKKKFFANRLPGAAAVGSVTEGAYKIALLKDAQSYIDEILDSPANRNKTGAQLGLLGTPGVMCSNPEKTIIVNSNVLTPADLEKVKNISVHGGAEFLMVYMPQPTRDRGNQNLHFEPVVLPKDPKDGKALTYSVTLAPEKKRLAYHYIAERYNVKSLGIPTLTSDYGRMLSVPDDKNITDPPNIVLAVRKSDWHLTIVETLGHEKAKQENPVPEQDYGRISFPASGAAWWPDLSVEQHSRLLRVEALFNIAAERGEILRGGKHTPCNSCGAYSSSILAMVLPEEVLTMMDAHTTELDQLALKLMHIAPKHLWVKDSKLTRLYDIVSENRLETYEEISRNDAEERVLRLTRDQEMNKLTMPGFSSWINSYGTYSYRHPDLKARELYEQATRTFVDELKIMSGMGDDQVALG